MENYRYFKIDDNSYTSIQELYLRSFQLKSSIEAIKRKYDTTSFGEKNIGFLAVDTEGDLAAYYGVFPITMVIDGTDYLVAQSGDTMTAPEHRKKGLFTILAKLTYDLSEKKGLSFIFGFPNENSFPGFIKHLDWKFYGNMKSFTIQNTGVPLCELSAKYRFLAPLYQKYCAINLRKHLLKVDTAGIRGFDDTNAFGFVKKSVDFFNYKLQNKNSYLITYEGFSLLIKLEPHLLIGAVAKFELSRTNEFIIAIKRLAFRLGSRKIIITVSENHWLFDALKNELSYTDSLPIGYFEIDKSIPYDKICYSGADYDTF